MTRAQRIVRLTFWMTNLFFVIIGCFFWLKLAVGVKLGLILLASLTLGLMLWYMQKYLGVTEFRGLYFVDDERERAIALRVHNACLNTFIYSSYGLMIVTFILMDGFELTIRTFGNTILVLIMALMAGVNGQYYYLWHKYDQE